MKYSTIITFIFILLEAGAIFLTYYWIKHGEAAALLSIKLCAGLPLCWLALIGNEETK